MSSPIDLFAENPQLTPLLDIAGEWHELFEQEDYQKSATLLKELEAKAYELLQSDPKEARLWAARAMGVAGLARASFNYGVSNV